MFQWDSTTKYYQQEGIRPEYADGYISGGLESLQLSLHALREANSDGNVKEKLFDFLIYSSRQST